MYGLQFDYYKYLKNCLDDGRSIAEVLAERTRSEVVQVIGKKIVLYKPAKDEAKRKDRSALIIIKCDYHFAKGV